MERQLSLLNALRQALDGFENDESWNDTINRASIKNRWFEPDGIRQALWQWQNSLQESAVQAFLSKYNWPDLTAVPEKTLGLILAGNIPMVGLQDAINGIICGYKLKVKCSSDDEVLIPFLFKRAATINPIWEEHVLWSDDMKGIDAAIATGSNNSGRYFEYYFRNFPHIIRKNRNSVAVLTGAETDDEIVALGNDVFDYFGLGCRNVTHVLLPENYDLGRIFQLWDTAYLGSLVNHNKYVNNYHYHKSLLLMNLDPHVDTGYVIAKKSNELYAPVGMLHYSFYTTQESCVDRLVNWGEAIQVVSTCDIEIQNALEKSRISCVQLGKTQCTTLMDFADNIDTVNWLLTNQTLQTDQ